MEGALAHFGVEGSETESELKGKHIAIMGCGNVSRNLMAVLAHRGVRKITASDISAEAIRVAKEHLQREGVAEDIVEIRQVERGDCSVLFEDADVVSPCAVGGVLNPDTIPEINATIVCGAANNQLLDDTRDDGLLKDRGITYVPDFLANRMGIVNCANEAYGYLDNDHFINRHFTRDWERSIYCTTKAVLERAQRENIASGEAANKIADELMRQPHPIFGNRGQQIINDLVANDWHLQ